MSLSIRKITFFTFLKLPSVFWLGIRVKSMDHQSCSVAVRHRWITQNPFKSLFWAVQGMAAEMPGGLLLQNKIKSSGQNIAMLLVGSSSKFTKKAVGKILFTFEQGDLLDELVNQAVKTKEAQTITIKTNGVDEKGDVVSEFSFNWSIKLRSKK